MCWSELLHLALRESIPCVVLVVHHRHHLFLLLHLGRNNGLEALPIQSEAQAKREAVSETHPILSGTSGLLRCYSVRPNAEVHMDTHPEHRYKGEDEICCVVHVDMRVLGDG